MFGLFINWDSILILSFGWWHGNELDLCFFIDFGLFAPCDLYLGLWRLLCCWAWILIKFYDLGFWSLCFALVYLLDIKLGLILVVNLGLFIKLGLNYKILNLDLIGFILIYHIWTIFVFVWALRTYWLSINYDTWSTKFHGTKWNSKSYKWNVELVVSLLGTFLISHLYLVLFLLISVNIYLCINIYFV